jgi:integrase
MHSHPPGKGQSFPWESELRGFGVRAIPSGLKTFILQYRNAEGRSRRIVIAGISQKLAHTPRHTFGSVAGDLGCSELTIAALLGHAARGAFMFEGHLLMAVYCRAVEDARWQCFAG